MTERNVGRPWTSEEDALLKEAVEIHGEIDNWKTIALAVPGRSNKACRKRWLHSLSPTVKKSAWTPAEDQRLLECYKALGPRWSAIARQIPGRTDDACSKRYREALDPTLKKDEWTPEEDLKLIQVYNRIGVKWGQVGHELNRSGLACRNRWRLLERKKSAVLAKQKDATILDHHCYSREADVISQQRQEIEYANFSQTSGHEDGGLLEEYYYYPQQAYSFMETESTQSHFSPEPASQHLIPQDIHNRTPIAVISTFSSLENALSDPPPGPRPLPSVAPTPSVSSATYPTHADPDLMSPSTMSPQPGIVGLMDSQMTLADRSQYSSPAILTNDVPLSPHPRHGVQPPSSLEKANDAADYTTPEIYSHESHTPLSIDTRTPAEGSWRSPSSAGMDLFDQITPFSDSVPDHVHGGLPSSSASTPFDHASPISGTPSPCLLASADLPSVMPNATNPPTESLLFSSSRPPAAESSRQAKKKKSPIQVRRILEDTKPHRLSSRLRLSADSSLLPYACGYDHCWPATATLSSGCFATSRELSEHAKIHSDEESSRPFRCGLSGCGKSWKSINGLQYHLQISPAHYRQALSSRFSSTLASSIDTPEPEESEGEAQDKKTRKYICQHPGCFKAYRQLSGLRYHRKHGHPQDMPAQLEVVPPTLAAQLPSKTKKMRRKNSTSQASK